MLNLTHGKSELEVRWKSYSYLSCVTLHAYFRFIQIIFTQLFGLNVTHFGPIIFETNVCELVCAEHKMAVLMWPSPNCEIFCAVFFEPNTTAKQNTARRDPFRTTLLLAVWQFQSNGFVDFRTEGGRASHSEAHNWAKSAKELFCPLSSSPVIHRYVPQKKSACTQQELWILSFGRGVQAQQQTGRVCRMLWLAKN